MKMVSDHLPEYSPYEVDTDEDMQEHEIISKMYTRVGESDCDEQDWVDEGRGVSDLEGCGPEAVYREKGYTGGSLQLPLTLTQSLLTRSTFNVTPSAPADSSERPIYTPSPYDCTPSPSGIRPSPSVTGKRVPSMSPQAVEYGDIRDIESFIESAIKTGHKATSTKLQEYYRDYVDRSANGMYTDECLVDDYIGFASTSSVLTQY